MRICGRAQRPATNPKDERCLGNENAHNTRGEFGRLPNLRVNDEMYYAEFECSLW